MPSAAKKLMGYKFVILKGSLGTVKWAKWNSRHGWW